MNCYEVESLMEAYLGSEMDTRSAAYVTAHLEACAARFRSSRHANERVTAFLQKGQGDKTLWQHIEHEALRRDSANAWRLRPRYRLDAAAVVVTLLASVIGWRQHRTGRDESNLLAAVEKDRCEFLACEFGPAFTGPPPAHVIAAAAGRVDAPPFATLPRTEGFKTEGSSFCYLYGVPVAWTLERWHGQPVSWIAFRREELPDFSDVRRAFERGVTVVSQTTGPFQFAAHVMDKHVVCALPDVSPDELQMLVESVPGGVQHG